MIVSYDLIASWAIGINNYRKSSIFLSVSSLSTIELDLSFDLRSQQGVNSHDNLLWYYVEFSFDIDK